MRDLAKVTVGLNKRHPLAAEIGGAQLVEIPDSGTFIPLDRPQALASHIADFAAS